MSEFVKEISGAELEAMLGEKDKVFVDFFATWCGPCKMLAPVIDEVAQDHPDVTFVKVDVDRNLDATRKYRVMAMPTVVVFENGKEKNRNVGYVPAEVLKDLLWVDLKNGFDGFGHPKPFLCVVNYTIKSNSREKKECLTSVTK